MSTCNRLDLETLGSQPVMPKNIPDHRSTLAIIKLFTQWEIRGWSNTHDSRALSLGGIYTG